MRAKRGFQREATHSIPCTPANVVEAQLVSGSLRHFLDARIYTHVEHFPCQTMLIVNETESH